MKNFIACGIALLLFFFVNKTVAQSAKTFNLVHDYPTYLDVQFKDSGKAVGAFESYTVEVKNISSADIACSIEFTINDNCGNSQIIYFPGGLNLKVGKSGRSSDELSWKCKEYRIDSGNKFGIASVYCRVFDFKNLTEEANKYKEEQKQKQQKLDEEKAKREKIAFDKEVQQIRDQREKERLLAEKEEAKNSPPTSTSYYNNTTTTNSKPRQPTWQERDAQIKAENQRIYEQNQQRIAETQRRSQEQSEQFVNGATEIIGLVGNIFEQARIDREKKEAKAEAAAQRERQRRQEEAERLAETARQKAQLIVLRNSFFDEFPEGGVPLSSQKINAKELYYFVYLFNKNEIGETRPTIILSDTFVISQYKDGTWPFKSNIIFDIEKLANNGTITLVGYFTTKTLAEEMRNNFLEIANNSNLVIEKISYKGKKLNLSSSDDFWENGLGINKIESAGKAKLILAKGDEDFWETGQEQKKLSGDKKKVAPVNKKDKK